MAADSAAVHVVVVVVDCWVGDGGAPRWPRAAAPADTEDGFRTAETPSTDYT